MTTPEPTSIIVSPRLLHREADHHGGLVVAVVDVRPANPHATDTIQAAIIWRPDGQAVLLHTVAPESGRVA